MSVIVVGLEQKQAPLELLDRVSITESDTAKALGRLRDQPNLSEAVLLSTCLRTEVYAVVERFHDGVTEIQEFLADVSGSSVDALAEFCTIRFDDDVTSHLFSVASGLDSAVLGESEVLGQVRRAWERAQGEHSSGPVLGTLFRHAVETGKRVRSETAIARGITSLSHGAVALAADRRPGGLRAPGWRSSARARWARAWPRLSTATTSSTWSWPTARRSGPRHWSPGCRRRPPRAWRPVTSTNSSPSWAKSTWPSRPSAPPTPSSPGVRPRGRPHPSHRPHRPGHRRPRSPPQRRARRGLARRAGAARHGRPPCRGGRRHHRAPGGGGGGHRDRLR